MENFLRDGVDLRSISNHTIGGDGHYFEDNDSPEQIKSYLNSQKVNQFFLFLSFSYSFISYLFSSHFIVFALFSSFPSSHFNSSPLHTHFPLT